MMNKKIGEIIKILDFGIIGFKIFCFGYLLIKVIGSDSIGAEKIYIHYLVPFVCYAIINIVRLFKQKFKKILVLEMLINIFFITINYNHVFFLILSILSYFGVMCVTKKSNGNFKFF